MHLQAASPLLAAREASDCTTLDHSARVRQSAELQMLFRIVFRCCFALLQHEYNKLVGCSSQSYVLLQLVGCSLYCAKQHLQIKIELLV
jgi:uncharacterized metal-binding protein